MAISTSTVISFRTDKKLKKQAESIFGELGISTSSAINMFLRQCVRKRAIPFELTTEEAPEERNFSPRLLAALEEAEAIKRGEVEAKTYTNVRQMFKDILAEDDDGEESND